MQPEYYQNRPQSPFRQFVSSKRLLIIITTLIILAICSTIIAIHLSHSGKYKIKIQFAPSYAEIRINDKKYKNNSYAYLTPGEYEVFVNAPEFEPLTYKVLVDDNTKYIYGSLNPATALGNELESNKLANEFLAIEGIGGEIINTYSERLLEEYPIFKFLPYENISKNGSITIGYLFNDYSITIKLKNFSKPNNISYYLKTSIEELLSFAEQTGKPLAEYNINIEDFTNPFAKIAPNSESDPKTFLQKAISDLKIDPSTITYNEDFRQDNIYYTTISWKNKDSYIPIVYRVALIQDGNTWKFSGPPYPIATTTNMPNVPTEILTALNKIQIESERES